MPGSELSSGSGQGPPGCPSGSAPPPGLGRALSRPRLQRRAPARADSSPGIPRPLAPLSAWSSLSLSSRPQSFVCTLLPPDELPVLIRDIHPLIQRFTLTISVLRTLGHVVGFKRYLLSEYVYTWKGKRTDRSLTWLQFTWREGLCGGGRSKRPLGSPLGDKHLPNRLHIRCVRVHECVCTCV